MENKHTPGPWRSDETRHHILPPGKGSSRTFEIFTNADIKSHRHIATVESRDGKALGSLLAESEGEANARLIATSPDMLIALKGLKAEVKAILGLAESEILDTVGATNLDILRHWLRRADRVVLSAEGQP